jgi:DNA polymerase family B
VARDDLLVIGFDSEYTFDPQTNSNIILSYQYAGRTAKGTWSGIIFPDNARRERIKMVELLGKAIEDGRAKGLIGYKWPKVIHAAAHFSRADLAAFRDFPDLKNQFEGPRKTFATLTAPWKTHYNDSANNRHELTVYLIDTMLLTPGGAGLAELGEMYEFEKILLPPGMISRMDQLLREDTNLFTAYAIRDAEIAALHAWRMAEFARENLAMKKLPVSLGSLAVRYLKTFWEQEGVISDDVLGIEEVKKLRKWDGKAKRFRPSSKTIYLPSVHDHVTLVTECFHGGRNEAYYFGFTPFAPWTDYDLKSAYGTAMAAIRMPDYQALRIVTDPLQYSCDSLGLARIRFGFPRDTRFPCLPVRTQNGLVFPLEGTTSVAAPEIKLALDMGADLTIEHGVIVPWKSESRPFELFIKSVREKRDQEIKGSVVERTWKEIGNSVYGKIAQGLRGKRVYDNLSNEMKPLPPSEVTQPYLAAFITSLIRGVLGEILHRIPESRTVVSATTDGFLTNACDHELDLSGSLCKLFSGLSARLTGSHDFLEAKHRAAQLLCWKTRGQASINAIGIDLPPVIAKAGIAPPKDILDVAYRTWEENDVLGEPPPAASEFRPIVQNDWIVDLFIHRTTDTTVRTSSLRSLRDMVEGDADLVREESEQTSNMEFDWKRELVGPHETQPFITSSHPHFAAHSKPWTRAEDFERERALFDQWRTKRGGVLKTMADWQSWTEYRKSGDISKKGVKRAGPGIMNQVKRNFLRAYVNGLWGLPGGDYKGIAAFLTLRGYETSADDLKNAKRSKKEPAEHLFDANEDVMGFIKVVLERFPDFEWRRMIEPRTCNVDRTGIAAG